jgi:hypothetical protein
VFVNKTGNTSLEGGVRGALRLDVTRVWEIQGAVHISTRWQDDRCGSDNACDSTLLIDTGITIALIIFSKPVTSSKHFVDIYNFETGRIFM